MAASLVVFARWKFIACVYGLKTIVREKVHLLEFFGTRQGTFTSTLYKPNTSPLLESDE